MKKLIFSFLFIFLITFNYFEECKASKIEICKEACKFVGYKPEFCESICKYDPEWEFLDISAVGDFLFYNRKTIPVSPNIIRVWTLIIYTEKSRPYYVKKYGKMYENLDYALNLLEINCTKGIYRYLEYYSYASDGSIIRSSKKPDLWKTPSPYTATENLIKEVCQRR